MQERWPSSTSRLPVRLELAALWTATMFLFAYGDIVTVYRAETVAEILHGKISGIEVTGAFLLATSVYVATPSVMVFLSLALRPRVSRWMNIAAGAIYALTIVASADSWKRIHSSISIAL